MVAADQRDSERADPSRAAPGPIHTAAGAADELVQSLLRSERLRPEELERVGALIARARRQRGKKEK